MSSENGAVRTLAADRLALLGLLLAALALLALAGRPLATDDLWWHLKLGEVYAEHGPRQAEDPLFHTVREQPTVPHEWLFQVGVHALDRAFGFHGLRAVHALLVAVILFWVFRIFRRTAGNLALAAGASTVFIALSWYRLFQFRPELVSLPALLTFYVLLLEKTTPPSRWRLAGAVLLLAVWANLHSVFAIGPALLLAALLGLALERALGSLAGIPDARPGAAAWAHRLGAVLVLGILAAGLNPRGFAQHATFFTEAASGDIWQLRDDFLSWNPLVPARGNRALTPYCWVIADALLAAFTLVSGARLLGLWRKRTPAALRELDALHLGLGAASFAAMFVAVRFHWMCVFPLLYLLRAARRVPRPALSRAAAVTSLALALALPVGIQLDSYRREVLFEPGGYWQSPYLAARYCDAGMRFLRDSRLKGRLFHPFNLGGFLGYWLSPRLRTFIDGRMDHYPGAVLEDYVAIRGAARLDRQDRLTHLLDARNVDVYLGTSFVESRYAGGSWTDHLRRLPGWLTIFSSQECAAFLRDVPRNRPNFHRVARYYAGRRIPFSPSDGVDVATAIHTRPDWSKRYGLVPREYERLLADRASPLPAVRSAALEALAQIYWRVGAFRDSAAIDRELVEERPEARVPRRRLADALLQLGRPGKALALTDKLMREDPGDSEVWLIHHLARERAPTR
jgi:hypothetical protein